jgi:hypothetical protein
VQWDEPGESF